jgi:hypothetical protein
MRDARPRSGRCLRLAGSNQRPHLQVVQRGGSLRFSYAPRSTPPCRSIASGVFMVIPPVRSGHVRRQDRARWLLTRNIVPLSRRPGSVMLAIARTSAPHNTSGSTAGLLLWLYLRSSVLPKRARWSQPPVVLWTQMCCAAALFHVKQPAFAVKASHRASSTRTQLTASFGQGACRG